MEYDTGSNWEDSDDKTPSEDEYYDGFDEFMEAWSDNPEIIQGLEAAPDLEVDWTGKKNCPVPPVTISELDKAIAFQMNKVKLPRTKETERTDARTIDIIMRYVINREFDRGIRKFAITDVDRWVNVLLVESTLNVLEKEGYVESLIDETGEVTWRNTEKGSQVAKELKKAIDEIEEQLKKEDDEENLS